MPSLSPTMTEGLIVKWLKQEGDIIAPGDVLCEIQTDKAVVSLEFDEEGILAKILKSDSSSDIKVGTPIALVVDKDDDWKNVEISKNVEVCLDAKSETQSSHPPLVPTSTKDTLSAATTKQLIGPAVRNLLIQYGLNATQIPASGSHGNVLKGDILRQVTEKNIKNVSPEKSRNATGASTTSPLAKPVAFVDVEVTSLRRIISRRLLEAKPGIPHAYSTTQCKTTNLTALRKRMQNVGMKVSVNDFIIKSTANALTRVPEVNVVLEGTELRHKERINISFAVVTNAGLMTPFVSDANRKDVVNISADVAELAAKARNGNLQPHEFIGGTFTISNLGKYGIHNFTAMINPSQCAILAVGGIHAYLGENGELENKINLTLSYNANGIPEDIAFRFLAHLKHELENITEITMGIYNIDSRFELMQL